MPAAALRGSQRRPMTGWLQTGVGSTSPASEILRSRLQLAFDFVQKAPVGTLSDDLLRARLDEACVAEAQRVEPDRVLGVVFAPFVTVFTRCLEGRVVARGEPAIGELLRY